MTAVSETGGMDNTIIMIMNTRIRIWRGCPAEVGNLTVSVSWPSAVSRVLLPAVPATSPPQHPSTLDGNTLRQDWSATVYEYCLLHLKSQLKSPGPPPDHDCCPQPITGSHRSLPLNGLTGGRWNSWKCRCAPPYVAVPCLQRLAGGCAGVHPPTWLCLGCSAWPEGALVCVLPKQHDRPGGKHRVPTPPCCPTNVIITL